MRRSGGTLLTLLATGFFGLGFAIEVVRWELAKKVDNPLTEFATLAGLLRPEVGGLILDDDAIFVLAVAEVLRRAGEAECLVGV